MPDPIQDIMNLLARGGGGGVQAPLLAPEPQPTDLSAVIARLIEQSGQPQEVPLLDVGKEESKLKGIGAGIADALSTYAAGISTRGLRPTTAVADLRQRRNVRDAKIAENENRTTSAANRARDRQLGLALGEAQSQRARGEKVADVASGREFTLGRDSTLNDFAAARQTNQQEFAKTLQGLRAASAKELAGFESASTRKFHAENLQAARAGVIAIKRGIEEDLSNGKTTDQIREEFLDDMESAILTDTQRQEILAFFEDKVGSRLFNIEGTFEGGGLGPPESLQGEFVVGSKLPERVRSAQQRRAEAALSASGGTSR